jgi:hypothetical protein
MISAELTQSKAAPNNSMIKFLNMANLPLFFKDTNNSFEIK